MNRDERFALELLHEAMEMLRKQAITPSDDETRLILANRIALYLSQAQTN
jgi:hypothetical protein